MCAWPRRLQLTLFGVVLAHAGVLWWLVQHGAANTSRPIVPPLLVRWLPPPALPPHLPPAASKLPPIHKPQGAVAPRPAAPAPQVLANEEAATPQASLQPPTDGPAAPALRADSIARAARESARRKGVAELSDERLGQQPVSAQAALGAGVAAAARGDCLKGGEGGYANSGLGLLALPVFVLDVARGRCRR
jgi:hypothetical protein